MKRIFTLLSLLFLVQISFGQRTCGTTKLVSKKMNDQSYIDYRDELNQFTKNWEQENKTNKQNEVVTISVVVHVLHKGGSDNISEAQINSQFVVLNNDFRKLNSNFSSTPSAFQSLAADTEIEFCLAKIDPNGNATSGITRTQVSSPFDAENDFYEDAFGGKTPWDNSKYLNIWVVDLGSSGLLGFATPPGFTSDNDDGAVIDYRAFGTVGTAVSNAPNHLGRTATHEIGHYLNLEHVWGPTNGGCAEDDGVSDTPNQNGESGGCPSFPLTDACTTSGDGIMYVNYMDYSDDDCMTMFTVGQKSRMLAAIDGPRSGLKSSGACSGGTPINDNISNIEMSIYPNPSNSFVNIEFENNAPVAKIEIINALGKVVSVTEISKNSKDATRINVADLEVGIYFVRLLNEDENVLAFNKFLVKK